MWLYSDIHSLIKQGAGVFGSLSNAVNPKRLNPKRLNPKPPLFPKAESNAPARLGPGLVEAIVRADNMTNETEGHFEGQSQGSGLGFRAFRV